MSARKRLTADERHELAQRGLEVKRMADPSECSLAHEHARDEPGPFAGYVEWHEWAYKKAEDHDQHRCPGCGRYVIWIPRASWRSEESST